MSDNLKIDIEGTLNNLPLSEKKGLLPLFEAIINSIQAISDSSNKTKGEIEIHIQKEFSSQLNFDETEDDGKISGFAIKDNGIGFDSKNFNSFKTAYSTYKKSKGCKGIGRFLWLKAFNSIEIESTFVQDGEWKNRKFIFSKEGITNEKEECSNSHALSTTVLLKELKAEYQTNIPKSLDELAKRIVDHCLLFFIYSEDCPKITLYDDESEASLNLNDYFDKEIKDSLDQDEFFIGRHQFKIYHVQMSKGATNHLLHFCANMYEVMSVKLKNKIPELQTRITSPSDPDGFYYCGYLTSDYLDEIVNSSRTQFEFYDQDEQKSLLEPSKNDIINSSLDSIRSYLSDYIDKIKKDKKEQIDTFVKLEHPTYRQMLNLRPNIYDEIPANLSDEELDLELHKHVQKWELEIKEKGIALDRQIKSQNDSSTLMERFEAYWTDVTEISKTCLAEYVTRRKALLSVLEGALIQDENGRFKKEEVIHSLICPMRHTSDDIEFEEMNLWVVDERLAYHSFLASDKTIKSMPTIDSNSTKEPDIAIFDNAFAFSDSDEPFNTVTIIEFKKPDNDSKNPISQVGQYIDLIKEGKKKKANGQSFGITNGTIFRCYIICDLTDKMRNHCKDSNLYPTPDNRGFTGFNISRNAYFEVISYAKLLSDAKKRNQIFFDKLFSPKPGLIMHFDNSK